MDMSLWDLLRPDRGRLNKQGFENLGLLPRLNKRIGVLVVLLSLLGRQRLADSSSVQIRTDDEDNKEQRQERESAPSDIEIHQLPF
jgi:hypothetical protein